MPARLRPKAPIAPDAIVVGDPGRALLLAQELLEEPKMSNHARGLWGYSGRTSAGRQLTVQATGMGGPSAAVVLSDLATLGVRRAVRIGTCSAIAARARPGELLLVEEAIAEGGSAASFGVPAGAAVLPDPDLLAALQKKLPGARAERISSVDLVPAQATPADEGAVAVDMQTAALLATAKEMGIGAAAILIVTEAVGEAWNLADEDIEAAAKTAGAAAAAIL